MNFSEESNIILVEIAISSLQLREEKAESKYICRNQKIMSFLNFDICSGVALESYSTLCCGVAQMLAQVPVTGLVNGYRFESRSAYKD
jgi:hypothetical protein